MTKTEAEDTLRDMARDAVEMHLSVIAAGGTTRILKDALVALGVPGPDRAAEALAALEP